MRHALFSARLPRRFSVGVVLTDERGHVLERWVADRGLSARFDKILLAPGFLYEPAGADPEAPTAARDVQTTDVNRQRHRLRLGRSALRSSVANQDPG